MYAVMIGSSTYVGMITVRRAQQEEKAWSDMVTREVGRDRLVRARLSRWESYKRRRRRRRRREVNYLVYYRYIIAQPNPASICIIPAYKYTNWNHTQTNSDNHIHTIIHTHIHKYNQYVCTCHYTDKLVKEIS
jgi:hypothetical protein